MHGRIDIGPGIRDDVLLLAPIPAHEPAIPRPSSCAAASTFGKDYPRRISQRGGTHIQARYLQPHTPPLLNSIQHI
ncbi:MAG: hypothetical protein MPJ25_16145, partial [Pirellulales bacterium]|nr:hypothetical protein [Pirellulales bacterium]